MKKLFVASALFLGACVAQNMTPQNIHVQNGNYIKTIAAHDTVRESDGTMLVNITGETYEDTELFYRVVWFDKDGMKINSLLSKSVQARVRRDQPFHWSAVAPNKKATSYQVYVSDRVIEQ